MFENWDDVFDKLSVTRSLYHNEDYWRFLVRDVWRIDQRPIRVVDFGCGYGWVGLFLMPMLADGSDYTGVDAAQGLLQRARARQTPYRSEFVHCDASATPFADDTFDVAIAHTLMMHLPEPRNALAEMMRVTRDGGLVITADASRNAVNALTHVHETDEQEHMPLALVQGMNAWIRRNHGVDYNIGMKMPVLMHQAGLQGVQARISDAVRTSFPPLEGPEQERVFNALCDDGLAAHPTDEAGFAAAVQWMTARGVDERLLISSAQARWRPMAVSGSASPAAPTPTTLTSAVAGNPRDTLVAEMSVNELQQASRMRPENRRRSPWVLSTTW